MANHASALKRARQSAKRREQNRSAKTRMKNAVKSLQAAIQEKSNEEAAAEFRRTQAVIAKTAASGIIHKNTAARKTSRLSKRVRSESSRAAG
ncbi:MAG: 30S ribosomal protein S20 [Desulfobacteraceae bacterium]|nr:MAG: 30S ribosomal protein S20 [Desulfobacteraceae bacterium]